jgi:hypothetical protein
MRQSLFDTEEMSSHPREKRAWEDKTATAHPRAREKSRADWKKDLQICGGEGK